MKTKMCISFFSCCLQIFDPHYLPPRYEFMDDLGEGVFGSVLKCWKKDTDEIVAIKFPKNRDNRHELDMMETLMIFSLHEHNIVRFLDSFRIPGGHGLVMEALDISLSTYISMTVDEIMPLSAIRSIIQQIAIALDALGRIGVIHTDIKPDNVMMVDHETQPFRVKLIDFGLAIYDYAAEPGMQLQAVRYRAPEIILGLPFTEAIDMWAVGCLMAYLLTKMPIFRGPTVKEVMQCIVFHRGKPADQLLDEGLNTEEHFIRTETNGWAIKEELSRDHPSRKYKNKLIKERLKNKSEAEAFEAEECIDLLFAMLEVNPAERITPAEVLLHPFILQTQENSTSSSKSSTSSSDCEPPVPAPTEKDTTNVQPAHRSPSPIIPPSRVIYVRPATAENTMRLEDEECALSLQIQENSTSSSKSSTSSSDCEPTATAPRKKDTTNVQLAHRSPSPTIPPSCVIYVRPATAENTMRLEDEECALSLQTQENSPSSSKSSTSSSDCEPPATAPTEKDTTNVQPAHRSPSPTIPPSRVIYVRPATAENTMRLEDEECALSLQTQENSTSSSKSSTSSSDFEPPATAPRKKDTTNVQPAHRSPSPTIPPLCVIYVRPATAENTMRLEDEECALSLQTQENSTSSSKSSTSSSDCEPPATAPMEKDTTNVQPAHRSPSPTIPPSCVIYVRPATAENTLRLEDEECALSLQASESSETISENDGTSMKNDSTVTESDTRTLTPADSSTSGKTELSSKKKKRKKNFFRRFCSWMKKTFSCVTCVDDE